MLLVCRAPFFAGDPSPTTMLEGHCHNRARWAVVLQGEALARRGLICGVHRNALERRLGGRRQQAVSFQPIAR